MSINMEQRHKLILVIIVACLACGVVLAAVYKIRESGSRGERGVVSLEKDTITVYYRGGDARLISKAVEVQGGLSERGRADLVFHELKRERVIPERAKLLDLAFSQNGVLYLNVSGEILERHVGTTNEVLATYGMVNSFVRSFRDVQRVQILVEGQPVYTLGGLVYALRPIEFNKDVMEE